MKLLVFLILGVGIASESVNALEVGGVVLERSATLSDGNVVVLNGGGIRQKFFVDVYVGALYVTSPSSSAETVMTGSQANRVELHILYENIPAKSLVKAWNDGFQANQSQEKLEQLHRKIDAFNTLFPAVEKGDVIQVDYLPKYGTQISINNEVLGLIVGKEFNQAVLSIWLGRRPVSRTLKLAMLSSE